MTHKNRKATARNSLIAAMIAAALLPATAFAGVDTITANVDLDQYKTYTWNQNNDAELSVAELAIRDAVDREMAAKGYTQVQGDADLQASLSAETWNEVQVDSRSPMLLNPRLDRLAFLRGVEVAEVRDIDRGRFDVRLSDADTAEMVWHGSAEGTPRSKMKKNVEEIDEAVEEMFEDFGEPNED